MTLCRALYQSIKRKNDYPASPSLSASPDALWITWKKIINGRQTSASLPQKVILRPWCWGWLSTRSRKQV